MPVLYHFHTHHCPAVSPDRVAVIRSGFRYCFAIGENEGAALVSNGSLGPAESVRLVNGRRVCDTVRNLWPHPEVFANCEAIAESGANRGNPSRSYCWTVVGVKMI